MAMLLKALRARCPKCGDNVKFAVSSYRDALKGRFEITFECMDCGTRFEAKRAEVICDVVPGVLSPLSTQWAGTEA